MAQTPADNTAFADSDVLTQGPAYTVPPVKTRVKWYRCKVDREELAKLNKRSDALGFAQTLGFLGLLALSSSSAIYSALHWPWYVTAPLVFINGHFWHFLINGFHELIHDSVFKTRWLNGFFLRVFSFLGQYNHHHFWASHTEHHRYTLHPPDDLEVTLPVHYNLTNMWKWGLINLKHPWNHTRFKLRRAMGRFPTDKWSLSLFPETDPKRRADYTRWERIVFLGHTLIALTFVTLAILDTPAWLVGIPTVTFPMMFGGWLHFFTNSSQHVGLVDNVPDFRLCCRTIYLNPFLQFLYWHMNYHTEHHMFAAVPCYNLPRLHRLIRKELPPCPRGLLDTWRVILDIQKKQKADPVYRFIARCPEEYPARLT